MVLKTDFTRGQENAQDDLNENFKQLEPFTQDTGWIDLPFDDNWEPYSGNTVNRLRAKKVNGWVQITGTVRPKNTVTVTSLTQSVDITKDIPAQFVPDTGVVSGTFMQGSGANSFYAQVSGGKVRFERHRNAAGTAQNYDSGNWFPVNLGYFAG